MSPLIVFISCNKDSVIFKNLIDKTKKYILFEEIEFIIFDHIKSYFSTRLIVNCVEHGLLFCDQQHIL